MIFSKHVLNYPNTQTYLANIINSGGDDTIIKSNLVSILPFLEFTSGAWSYTINSTLKTIIIYYYNSPSIIISTSGSDGSISIGAEQGPECFYGSTYYGSISCELYDNGALILTLSSSGYSSIGSGINAYTPASTLIYPPVSSNISTSDYIYGGIGIISPSLNSTSTITKGLLYHNSTRTYKGSLSADAADGYFVRFRPLNEDFTNGLNIARSSLTENISDDISLSDIWMPNSDLEFGKVGNNDIYFINNLPNSIRGYKYIKYLNKAWRIVYHTGTSSSTATANCYNKDTPYILLNTGEEFSDPGDVTTVS